MAAEYTPCPPEAPEATTVNCTGDVDYHICYGQVECPEITDGPNNDTIVNDGTAQFTVEVDSEFDITYQWQRLIGFTWTNLVDSAIITGSTTEELTLDFGDDPIANGTYQYRVLVTANGCTITSETADLIVDDEPEILVPFTVGAWVNTLGLGEDPAFVPADGSIVASGHLQIEADAPVMHYAIHNLSVSDALVISHWHPSVPAGTVIVPDLTDGETIPPLATYTFSVSFTGDPIGDESYIISFESNAAATPYSDSPFVINGTVNAYTCPAFGLSNGGSAYSGRPEIPDNLTDAQAINTSFVVAGGFWNPSPADNLILYPPTSLSLISGGAGPGSYTFSGVSHINQDFSPSTPAGYYGIYVTGVASSTTFTIAWNHSVTVGNPFPAVNVLCKLYSCNFEGEVDSFNHAVAANTYSSTDTLATGPASGAFYIIMHVSGNNVDYDPGATVTSSWVISAGGAFTLKPVVTQYYNEYQGKLWYPGIPLAAP